MAMVIGDFNHRPAVFGPCDTVEARTPAGVAGGVMPCDFDLEPDGILVAIGAQFPDRLEIARGLALFPKSCFASG